MKKKNSIFFFFSFFGKKVHFFVFFQTSNQVIIMNFQFCFMIQGAKSISLMRRIHFHKKFWRARTCARPQVQRKVQKFVFLLYFWLGAQNILELSARGSARAPKFFTDLHFPDKIDAFSLCKRLESS